MIKEMDIENGGIFTHTFSVEYTNIQDSSHTGRGHVQLVGGKLFDIHIQMFNIKELVPYNHQNFLKNLFGKTNVK